MRDSWAWVCLLAPIALFIGTRGAERGVAVAEDFDFLRRSLLEQPGSWLDGGGSLAFWRPVSHQLYYNLLGPLILEHPGVVSALHGVLLAIATLLLYRILRRSWSGPLAAAAATFPLFSESTRTLICWPSHFVDLGVYLFSMLALSEAAARRMPSALAALLAALLCKEVAIVTALMLPFMPGVAPGSRAQRLRWMLASGVLLVSWAAIYTLVRQQAGLELPHGLERDPTVIATGPLARYAWAVWNSVRAIASQSVRPGPWDGLAAALAVLLLAGMVVALGAPAARARAGIKGGWAAWGAVWFLLASATLTTIFPLWSPNRSQFASAGFGVAAVGLAGAAHPGLAALLVSSRIALFALAPGVPRIITPEPEERGAFIDVPRLTRLQRMMRATRQALAARHATLPYGAHVVWHNLPLSTEYAFGGSHALQVWYRDTTLRCVSFDSFKAGPAMNVVALISYQPRHMPQVVVLEPDAMRAQIDGVAALRAGQWQDAIASLDRADSLQIDRRAAVFRGDNAGRRAYALVALGRIEPAAEQARYALAIAPEDAGARLVLAVTLAARGERASALAQIDTVLALGPDQEEALSLRAQITGKAPQP